MPRTSPIAPVGGYVTLKAPRFVLASPSEFILDGETPVAHKMRFGANWCGLDAMGETLKVSVKRLGEEKALANSNGGIRGRMWEQPGWAADIEVQHDRSMELLDLGDLISMWVLSAEDGGGLQTPEKLNFHVMAVGHDTGDSETCMYKITVEYKEGLSDITALIRAKCDHFGRVINYSTAVRVAATATAPGSVLPTDPP